MVEDFLKDLWNQQGGRDAMCTVCKNNPVLSSYDEEKLYDQIIPIDILGRICEQCAKGHKEKGWMYVGYKPFVEDGVQY